LLLNAEAAIVTSGTATLETAIFEVPQIVTYEGSPISYQIAKRLVKVKYISLVNLIAGREVVKEFIQHDFSPANVIGELKQILENKPYRVEMLKGYQHIRALLGNKNASTITAKEIVESLEASPG
jgi:lipid-A-disaccharide synthase